MFKNRAQAGEELATALADWKGRNPLILAIPRGGVPVAFALWRHLGGDLDVTQPRKLRSPANPELAVGAVAPDGTMIIDDVLVERLGVTADYLRQEAARQQAESRRRLELYRGSRPLPAPAGRHVIIVDDGVATGATVLLALRLARQAAPATLLLAVPVAPPDSLARLQQEADQVVCLLAPAFFLAVGQFYEDFRPVSDDEVRRLLQMALGETPAS